MNWVGGARKRIQGSLQNDRKIQKQYFERKRLEAAISTQAKLKSSTEKNDSGKKSRPKISQDILAFRMADRTNHSQRPKDPPRFRVIDLGKKTVPGFKTVGGKRIQSVELPLSPLETPSVLNLSHSPTRLRDRGETTDSSFVPKTTEKPPKTTNRVIAPDQFFDRGTSTATNRNVCHENVSAHAYKMLLDGRRTQGSDFLELFGAVTQKPSRAGSEAKQTSHQPQDESRVYGFTSSTASRNPEYRQKHDMRRGYESDVSSMFSTGPGNKSKQDRMSLFTLENFRDTSTSHELNRSTDYNTDYTSRFEMPDTHVRDQNTSSQFSENHIRPVGKLEISYTDRRGHPQMLDNRSIFNKQQMIPNPMPVIEEVANPNMFLSATEQAHKYPCISQSSKNDRQRQGMFPGDDFQFGTEMSGEYGRDNFQSSCSPSMFQVPPLMRDDPEYSTFNRNTNRCLSSSGVDDGNSIENNESSIVSNFINSSNYKQNTGQRRLKDIIHDENEIYAGQQRSTDTTADRNDYRPEKMNPDLSCYNHSSIIDLTDTQSPPGRQGQPRFFTSSPINDRVTLPEMGYLSSASEITSGVDQSPPLSMLHEHSNGCRSACEISRQDIRQIHLGNIVSNDGYYPPVVSKRDFRNELPATKSDENRDPTRRPITLQNSLYKGDRVLFRSKTGREQLIKRPSIALDETLHKQHKYPDNLFGERSDARPYGRDVSDVFNKGFMDAEHVAGTHNGGGDADVDLHQRLLNSNEVRTSESHGVDPGVHQSLLNRYTQQSSGSRYRGGSHNNSNGQNMAAEHVSSTQSMREGPQTSSKTRDRDITLSNGKRSRNEYLVPTLDTLNEHTALADSTYGTKNSFHCEKSESIVTPAPKLYDRNAATSLNNNDSAVVLLASPEIGDTALSTQGQECTIQLCSDADPRKDDKKRKRRERSKRTEKKDDSTLYQYENSTLNSKSISAVQCPDVQEVFLSTERQSSGAEKVSRSKPPKKQNRPSTDEVFLEICQLEEQLATNATQRSPNVHSESSTQSFPKSTKNNAFDDNTAIRQIRDLMDQMLYFVEMERRISEKIGYTIDVPNNNNNNNSFVSNRTLIESDFRTPMVRSSHSPHNDLTKDEFANRVEKVTTMSVSLEMTSTSCQTDLNINLVHAATSPIKHCDQPGTHSRRYPTRQQQRCSARKKSLTEENTTRNGASLREIKYADKQKMNRCENKTMPQTDSHDNKENVEGESFFSHQKGGVHFLDPSNEGKDFAIASVYLTARNLKKNED